MFNMIFCDNTLIQKDIKKNKSNNNNIEISQSTISRILMKVKLLEKKLSLVLMEKNSDKHIDARAIYTMGMLQI